jgi:uncharacterized protein YegP (UPF0339 family)
MTGSFELFEDEYGCFRFRVAAPNGTIVALSTDFPDKRAAVAGIEAMREYAGMGLITDLCPTVPLDGSGQVKTARTKALESSTCPEPAASPAGQGGVHLSRIHQSPHTPVLPQLANALRRTGGGHPAPQMGVTTMRQPVCPEPSEDGALPIL